MVGILRNRISALIGLFFLLFSASGFSQETKTEEEPFDMSYMILHHIKDAHQYHILDRKDENGNSKSVFIPLPVILLDNGLQFFSSSKFYSEGEEIHEKINGHHVHYFVNTEKGYGLYDEKIYKLDENGKINFDEEGSVTNVRPLDFSITKNAFALLFTSVVLFLIFTTVARSYKGEGRAPKGIAKFLEPVIIFVRDNIAKENIGEKKYKKYMPYLLSVFFFIWINALLGLVPIFPGGTNVTGNISFTLTMALLTLIITIFSGNKHYWGHILSPAVPWPLYVIMIPIEIIGIFTKPFALTVRLFANMSAGHIIILAFVGIIFTFGNAAWSGLSVPMALFINILELLVGVLQAFIFTVLSALFIGEAVAEH